MKNIEKLKMLLELAIEKQIGFRLAPESFKVHLSKINSDDIFTFNHESYYDSEMYDYEGNSTIKFDDLIEKAKQFKG